MKKAIFLDRDGVINKICYHHDVGVYSPKTMQEFEVLEGVKEALQKLKDLGFMLIVVSNQPGVAFNYIKLEDLEQINHYLKNKLGIDTVYNCTHHPHHTGECECRKPKDGMLQQASKELNIDISKSYIIGDNLSDIRTGKNCKGKILLAPSRIEVFGLLEKNNLHPDFIVKNLLEASKKIEEIENNNQDLSNIPIMIVAAGVGSRLQDVTGKLPKCLVPVHGKPLMQYQIEEFIRQGFKNIIFCLGYNNTEITQAFQKGESLGANIKYSIEPFYSANTLSGTAGAVKYGQKLIEDSSSDTFIVFYGDNITTINFLELLEQHKRNNAFTTILLREPIPERVSDIITLEKNGRIKEFIEKPNDELKAKYKNLERYDNNGVYIFDKRVFNYIPASEFVDFSKQVIPQLIADGKRVFGHVCQSFFKELGRTAKFEAFLKEYRDSSFMIKEHEATFRLKNS